MDRISTFEKKFIDDKGRERIFSGVNVVDKSVFIPGKQNYMDVDENLIRKFGESGFNVIRLGFTWAKIEPQPQKYNDEYIDSLAQVLDWCEKYNIYAFLDMHQDIYAASKGTSGDGAPEWATLTDGYKMKPTRFIWAESYFWGKACHRAFDNFWANAKFNSKGLQDYYADCWKHIVKRLQDKPSVIGFDVMNEPFPGTDGGTCFRKMVLNAAKVILFDKEIKRVKLVKDVFSKDRVPKILGQISYSVLRKATSAADELIYNFDINKYAPFLTRISESIRDVDEDGILFMENCYYSNLGIPFSAPPIQVHGERDKHQVFAPHAYDLVVDTQAYKYASSDRVGGIFAQHKSAQDRLNVPVLVGEWGSFGGDGDEWIPHIAHLLTVFDKNKWSNTYWCYIPEFFESPLMRVFIRPFPKAVSGVIDEYTYNVEAKKFKLNFTQGKKDCGETVISVPFPVTQLMIDGKKAEIKQNGTELILNTIDGRHIVEVSF